MNWALSCREDTCVMMLLPSHTICLMEVVHLLLECNFGAPVLALIDQTYKNPSVGKPKLARYLESGLNATARTPKVCSFRIAKGASDEASCNENMRTRGAYPVWCGVRPNSYNSTATILTSPTAKYLPSLLIERQVAALILSRLVHVLEEGESPHSKLV